MSRTEDGAPITGGGRTAMTWGWLALALALVCAAGVLWWPFVKAAAPTVPAPPAPIPGATDVSTVARAVDGDTLDLTDGRRVRVLGIDAPERGECWFEEATIALDVFAPPGSPVTITPDPTQDTLDRYGRTLAYVDAAFNGDLGETLVRQGAARTYVYQGDPVTRAPAYDAAQAAAQRDHVGVWACPAT